MSEAVIWDFKEIFLLYLSARHLTDIVRILVAADDRFEGRGY